jgi:hypothetical protein
MPQDPTDRPQAEVPAGGVASPPLRATTAPVVLLAGSGWLLYPLAALLVVASSAGLGWPGLYAREVAVVRPALVAQDAFNLLVALPVLWVAATGMKAGSIRSACVWLGTLAYVVYSYAVYAFNVQHNALFLVYTALLSLATYGLLTGALAVPRDALSASLAPKLEKGVGAFMVGVGALFALVWLLDIGMSLATGRPPAITARYQIPTFAPYVLDLGFALPALIIGGVRLMAHRTSGRLLGGIMVPMIVLMMFQLGTGTAYQGMRTGQMDWGMLGLFNGLGLVGLLVAARFFSRGLPPASGAAAL